MKTVIDHIASLAYLTEPAPEQFVLNLKLDSDEFMRIEITINQLRGFVIDGAKLAYGATVTL